VLTEAVRGEGIEELWAAIGDHRRHLVESGQLERRRGEQLAGEVFAVASGRAKAHLERAVADDPELRRLLDEVKARRLDPLTAVQEIMDTVFRLDETT
jgi:LAO/AO transport system kinase